MKQGNILRCNACKNLIEVLVVGFGELVCCGEPMELIEGQKEEGGKEKHLPTIRETEGGVIIEVGSILHPMEKDHHIQWIELVIDNMSYRKFLSPDDKPIAKFNIDLSEGKIGQIEAREFCSLHGLWSTARQYN